MRTIIIKTGASIKHPTVFAFSSPCGDDVQRNLQFTNKKSARGSGSQGEDPSLKQQEGPNALYAQLHISDIQLTHEACENTR